MARVRVKGGYEPPIVHARAGEPLHIVFRREETASCSEHVVFPTFGKSAMLPPFEDVTIELVPERPGEYEFTCQTGLLHGRLVVDGDEEEPPGSRTPSRVARERPSLIGRVWGAALAAWGALVGLVPHALHHVGPLAGATLLAGATGRALFAAIGFVAAVPFLRRLQRRFQTWKAPVVALAVFVAAFSLSSFVIGPTISGGGSSARPGIEDGHAEHH